MLDKVEDESLQRGVVGLRQVVQDCIDGSQLFLLLWKLWGGQGYQSWVAPAMPSPPCPCIWGAPMPFTWGVGPEGNNQPTVWAPAGAGPALGLIPFSVAHQQP